MEIIGFKQDNNNIIKNKLENVISIELINRIQHIIHFNNLTENNIKEIIKKQLHAIKKKLKTRNIKFNYNDNLIKEIISQSNYELSGARNIKKIIDDKVDDIIINNLSKIDFKVNL